MRVSLLIAYLYMHIKSKESCERNNSFLFTKKKEII